MVTALALPNQKIINSSITALRFDQQIQTMMGWAMSRESKNVCVANVHMLMEAYWNSDFAGVLDNADLVTPDGMPLVWMMKLMGARQQDRVAGMDILLALCQQCQQRNVKVFFLGSQPEILDRMQARLDREFPNLPLAGMEPLPFRPLTPGEDDALVERINRSGAGLVLLSLGCPKQEKWMADHRGKLQAVTIGLGGVFPIYAGLIKHAPAWVRNNGLEWGYRLVQEPQRLWGRYSKTIPPFLWLASQQLLRERMLGELVPASDRKRFLRDYVRRYETLPSSLTGQPIGQVLQQAGLLSAAQIEQALQYQAEHDRLRFGEILASQGWVKPETVDFFVEQLPDLATTSQHQPLGYYLKSAALLDDDQIHAILTHQSKTGLRFGEMAVRNGWVKQETIDLFLYYLTDSAPALARTA